MKDKPTSDTICCICSKQLKEHKTNNHEFVPTRFVTYGSSLDEQERAEIINEMFNTIQNKNG